MTIRVTSQFVNPGSEQLFTLHYAPAPEVRGCIIVIPPFGEEMNRCRYLIREQCEQFARDGYYCVVLDLYGTGDSAGHLSDASWERWKSNVEAVADSVALPASASVILWGTRLGGLLACDVANSAPGKYAGLLMWQPVTSGKTYMTQVLRQRVAKLVDRGEPPEKTDEIRARLASGEKIEVGGYVLGGKLVAEIDSVKMSNFMSLAQLRINWLEQSGDEDAALSPAAERLVTQFSALGNSVLASSLCFPPLWQLPRRASMENLLTATNALKLN